MRGIRRQADHGQLEEGEIVHHRLRQVEMLAHRHLDVLQDRERGEQRAVLEEEAPALLDVEAGLRRERLAFCPNSATAPLSGVTSPVMTRISTDLPWPEPPTMARISPR